MTLWVGTWQDATIANGETSTDEINLGENCDIMAVIIPTVTSCTLKVQVSDVTGGTFVDLGSSVTTETTTGAYATAFKVAGYQFLKIVSSGAQGAARTFKVRGAKY